MRRGTRLPHGDLFAAAKHKIIGKRVRPGLRERKRLLKDIAEALDRGEPAFQDIDSRPINGEAHIVEKRQSRPLSGEFRRAYEQHSLGLSLEDALREAAVRIESSDFAFFVTAVLIQRQTGGDLSEVLKNISGMIRGRVRLSQHVKAKTAEGRFTGYVLVAFPAVMFLISYYLNPVYAGVLLHDPGGRMLLGAAVGLQLLGLFAIKKITTVKV